MTTLRYALEPKGPKRLEISWSFGGWRNFTIRLDDQIIGSISGEKELKVGRMFQLPDGSALKVQLVGMQLKVYRDGKPVPSFATDPVLKIKNASYAIFAIAGIFVILNIFFPISVDFLVFGLGFLGLGFLVKRRSFCPR